MKFDIAYSLNGQMDIEADTWEAAEAQLRARVEGHYGERVLEDHELEVFDVNEEEEE